MKITVVAPKAPKLYDAPDLETGSVYQIAGTKDGFVMKIKTNTGHLLVSMSTGIYIEMPHTHKYILVHAELVVS